VIGGRPGRGRPTERVAATEGSAAGRCRRDEPTGERNAVTGAQKAEDWGGSVEWLERLLTERTGTDLQEWNRRVRDTGIADEQELRSWLAGQGITGYPQMLLVMERFGYPDFWLASSDELIDGQYRDREQLRPILDALLAAAAKLGGVTVQARKGYVALVSPKRTFAMVQASTKNRVDLGLRLPGARPGGRLLAAKGLAHGTVRVALTSPDEVDDEVAHLLERAYDANF
jgi:hypothetical protein